RTIARDKSRDVDAAGGASASTYVSSGACSKCHLAQYIAWSNSPHSRATDPLPPRAIEFETSCLNCHATGGKRMNATNKPELAILQSVQCEQCHGPGSDHAARPSKGYGRIADMRTACATCHTPDTSPSFNPQTA